LGNTEISYGKKRAETAGGGGARGARAAPTMGGPGRMRTPLLTGVAFLVVVAAAGVTPPAAVAQIASVAVSARVVAVHDPMGWRRADHLPPSPTLDPVALRAGAGPAVAAAIAGGPAVIRTRLRAGPRIGDSDAGPLLEIILDYVGN
jgi:hypothetical protein